MGDQENQRQGSAPVILEEEELKGNREYAARLLSLVSPFLCRELARDGRGEWKGRSRGANLALRRGWLWGLDILVKNHQQGFSVEVLTGSRLRSLGENLVLYLFMIVLGGLAALYALPLVPGGRAGLPSLGAAMLLGIFAGVVLAVLVNLLAVGPLYALLFRGAEQDNAQYRKKAREAVAEVVKRMKEQGPPPS